MSESVILVVDDSEFDRNILANALSKKGKFKTIEAESGKSCLEIIDAQRIDLILMDIMMPGIHGTEVLTKIRERFNPIDLPIIMVTAKGDALDVVSSLQKGANDYITKPIHFDIAISRISIHLKLSEMSREMSRLREMAALDAMITTYNHEINNALAIALGCFETANSKDSFQAEKLKSALWRIADVVKKIASVREKKEIEYDSYAQTSRMVKIR